MVKNHGLFILIINLISLLKKTMNTFDLSKAPGGAFSITVNDNPPRSIYNPENLIVKPIADAAVVKLTDETWRQTFSMDDIVKEDGVTKSPFADVTALAEYLTGFFVNEPLP